MIASGKDSQAQHEPARGIFYGVFIGALVWIVVIGILVVI